MSNVIEVGLGSGVAGLAVLAQIPGAGLVDGDASTLLVLLLKAGVAGILGGITIYSLYRGGKTAEMLAETFKETMKTVEAAHVESSKRFSEDVDRLVKADTARTAVLDRAIQHCASINGTPR